MSKLRVWYVSVLLVLLAALTVFSWPSGWPYLEGPSNYTPLLMGNVLSITGVWLDKVDQAHAIPWWGQAGKSTAQIPVDTSKPEYNEWHSIIVKGTCGYSSLSPINLTGILAEYDYSDHRCFLIDNPQDVEFGGCIRDGEKEFTIYFRFCIDAGSIFGPLAGVRVLFGNEQRYLTLREGSSSNRAELILFVGDTVLPGAAGGWTWWKVWGTP